MYDPDIRVFLNNKYIEYKSIVKVQRAYRSKYKSKSAPSGSVIKNIHNNYLKTGSVGRKLITSREKTVRTDDLINAIENLHLGDPSISIRKIANLVPASNTVIQQVLREDLNLKSYKIHRTFKLFPADHQKRLNFVQFVKSRRINLETLFICSDEAYFYLHGGHNIQNNRVWSIYQPDELSEQPLFDEKVIVWCAFSAKRVYGPYFFDETVNGENYLDMLKKFFWSKHISLKNYKDFYFQQDGAPPHRRKIVQTWLKSKFGDRFIDMANWPPRSPDLNPCDFFLWGYLKSKVYNPKPQNLSQLKENITREIENFKKIDKTSIFLSLKKRLDFLKQENGSYFEHLL